MPRRRGEALTKARKPFVRYLWLLTLLVISCDLSSLVAPAASVPSQVPGALNTIVAQTAAAAWTQTAAGITQVSTHTPTMTLPPANTATTLPVGTPTPLVTPGPSPTFRFVLPTLAPTSNDIGTTLDCQLVSRTPDVDAHFSPKQLFQAAWIVRNTSSRAWDPNGVDFEFFSGAKIYTGPAIYDLSGGVAIGELITLSVTMAAPKSAGTYRTVWTLKQGKDDFCHLDLRIVVP